MGKDYVILHMVRQGHHFRLKFEEDPTKKEVRIKTIKVIDTDEEATDPDGQSDLN
jgi:hypothetical protein